MTDFTYNLESCIDDYLKISISFTTMLRDILLEYMQENGKECEDTVRLLFTVPIHVIESGPGGMTHIMNVSSLTMRLDSYVLTDDETGAEFHTDNCSDSMLYHHHECPAFSVGGRRLLARVPDMDIVNVIKVLNTTIQACTGQGDLHLMHKKRLSISRENCVQVFQRIIGNAEYRRTPVYFSDPYHVSFNTAMDMVAITSGELLIKDDRIIIDDCFHNIVIEVAGDKVVGYHTDYLNRGGLPDDRIPLKSDIDVVIETMSDIERVFMAGMSN